MSLTRPRVLLAALAIVGALAAVAFARKPKAVQASDEHNVEKASDSPEQGAGDEPPKVGREHSDEYGSSSFGL